MHNLHWKNLTDLIDGQYKGSPLSGFIIDSPWLPGWYGISTLDYYTSDKLWLEVNLKAIETFPDTMFLPGFWSEYGMCTEPSAFGSKLVWSTENLPHADRIYNDISGAAGLVKPNPKTDGLLPFMLNRLKNNEDAIKKAGHEIRFAVARGPLNIASFLMGTTEFMMALMMQPEETNKFLEVISAFTVDWLQLQKETFPTIDGIFVLDDLVGFVGEQECKDFVVPHLSSVFGAFDAKVKFFHNDAAGIVSSPFLKQTGINMFNFSHEHSINEIRELVGEEMVLLGNLPPRDTLAAGTEEQVKEQTKAMVNQVTKKERVVWSCGGGVPQNVSSENIQAFIDVIKG